MKGDGLSTFAGLVLYVLLMLGFASSIRAENLQDWDRVSTDQKAAAEASLIDTWLHRMAQTGQFLRNHPQVGVKETTSRLLYFVSEALRKEGLQYKVPEGKSKDFEILVEKAWEERQKVL